MSDCALDRCTQPTYLGIEFLLPVKQFPPCGFLNGVMKPEPDSLVAIPLKAAA